LQVKLLFFLFADKSLKIEVEVRQDNMFVIKSENRKGFLKANKILLFLQVIII